MNSVIYIHELILSFSGTVSTYSKVFLISCLTFITNKTNHFASFLFDHLPSSLCADNIADMLRLVVIKVDLFVVWEGGVTI